MKWSLLILVFTTVARADFDDSVAVSLCKWAANRLGPKYQALLDQVPGSQQYVGRELLREILKVRPVDCETRESAHRAANAFDAVASQHSGKVGVLLPINGKEPELSQALRAGIEAGFGDSSDKLLFRDASTPQAAVEAIAELLFKENVSMLIAGGDAATLNAISQWADGLLLPALFLASDEVNITKSHFAFRVYPRPQDMAETLMETAKEKGWMRLGILRPVEGQADRLVGALSASASKREIKVASFDYKTGDYRSMDEAIRKLFFIDPQLRSEEFRRLKRAAKLKAETLGLPFDARSVILRAIVEVDAVLIPNNFKIARNFATLMKFHGVPPLPLVGDMSWRSEGLIQPPEPFLFKSVFADFLGPCAALPKKLSIACSGEFVEAQSANYADYGVVAWRAARAAASVVSTPRAQIPKALAKLADLDPELFGKGLVFDADHTSRWPVHLFGVGKTGINPWIPSETLAATAE